MRSLSSFISRLSSIKGVLFGCASAVCYGTNPLGALHLYRANLAPDSVLCYRFSFGVLLLGFMMLVTRRTFRVSRRDLVPLIVLGLLFATSSLTYYGSFLHMDAGLASSLLFLYPLEVSIIMWLVFKEKVTRVTAIAIAASLAGLGLLYHSGEGGPHLSALGVLLVFISSVSYAVYIVIVNKSNLKMGSIKITFYAMLFCLIFLLLFSVIFGTGLPPMVFTPEVIGWGFMLGLVPTFLSLLFMAKAVKLVGSTWTAITGALEPLTAVTIGACVFGEVLTERLVAGIVLILFAVTLLALKKQRDS